MFDFQFPGWLTPYMNDIIRKGAESRLTDMDYVSREITRFLSSPRRADMLTGNRYYTGVHDILHYKKMVIGEGGEPTPVTNLPNDRLVNNQYGKLVDQKVNYLLGKEILFNTKDKTYSEILNNKIFDAKFDKLIQEIGEDSLNCGIGWIYIGYNEMGELSMQRIKPWQLIPCWDDEAHTILDYAIRIYPVSYYEGKTEKEVLKIEIYEENGINKLVKADGQILPDGINWRVPYFYNNEQPLGWDKIPLIPFRANRNELPLLKKVKSLQDALNLMYSNYTNNMQEDPRNTILVLKNYDGEDLGEFRQNLSTYGAVKVRTADGSQGGVDTLSIQVNAENYKVIIDLLKKAIIENAMGYDAKDDRLSGNANQMNIQSMYSDIDLDANKMETEYKASLQRLLWFVNAYLSQTGQGDYFGEDVEIVFNRDVLINEGEAIDNCVKSLGVLSKETVVKNHPWVNDVSAEMELIQKQNDEEYSIKLDNIKAGDSIGEE